MKNGITKDRVVEAKKELYEKGIQVGTGIDRDAAARSEKNR